MRFYGGKILPEFLEFRTPRRQGFKNLRRTKTSSKRSFRQLFGTSARVPLKIEPIFSNGMNNPIDNATHLARNPHLSPGPRERLLCPVGARGFVIVVRGVQDLKRVLGELTLAGLLLVALPDAIQCRRETSGDSKKYYWMQFPDAEVTMIN